MAEMERLSSTGSSVFFAWNQRCTLAQYKYVIRKTVHPLGADKLRTTVHRDSEIFNHRTDCNVRKLRCSLLIQRVNLSHISTYRRFLLACIYTKNDVSHFTVNFLSLMVVLIPKLPQFHGVRLFGINKYWLQSVEDFGMLHICLMAVN